MFRVQSIDVTIADNSWHGFFLFLWYIIQKKRPKSRFTMITWRDTWRVFRYVRPPVNCHIVKNCQLLSNLVQIGILPYNFFSRYIRCLSITLISPEHHLILQVSDVASLPRCKLDLSPSNFHDQEKPREKIRRKRVQ